MTNAGERSRRQARRVLRGVLDAQYRARGLQRPSFALCRVQVGDDDARSVAAWPLTDGDAIRYYLNIRVGKHWWSRVWARGAAVVDGTFVVDIERWADGPVACYLRWQEVRVWPTDTTGLEGIEAYARLQRRGRRWHLGERVIGPSALADADFMVTARLPEPGAAVAPPPPSGYDHDAYLGMDVPTIPAPSRRRRRQ